MSKVIFITGATAGFGAATAHLFAKNGWKIIATGRRLERLDALKAQYAEGVIHTVQMDLTDRESIVAAISNLPEAFKPVDCLFNNGGLALGKNPIPDVKMSDWQSMVDTNIMGLIHTTQEMIPLLKAAGRGATVINVGSVAGRLAYAGGNVYGASKAFVRQFSLGLRCDLEGTDIRVTNLEPGMAKSEFTAVRNYGDEAANEAYYDGVEPLRPEDIAETVWWLANLPPHMNVNSMEIMPLQQVPQGAKVVRR